MKSTIVKGVLTFLGVFLFLMALSYVSGYNKILYTKTVHKAQQNADREVFEETYSFVRAKRQEAIKLYKEWLNADEQGKKAIEHVVSLDFADFDEDKYITDSKLRAFISNAKH